MPLAAGHQGPSPDEAGHQEGWRQVLDEWRTRWNCPSAVELRDADRTLRLTLDEAAHATLLRAHLKRHGQAVLTEATPAAELGWLDGHAHEIALPLVVTSAPAPNPLRGCLPLVGNTQGHLPGSPESTWLNAKIHTHPERMDEIIAEHMPTLLAALGNPSWWFVRYHSPRETDHLRLRMRTDCDHYAAYVAAVGEWAQRMRQAGVAGQLVYDTYFPEIGRYGHGAAMGAAEDVFAADSRAVAVVLRHLSASTADRTALVAVDMVSIVSGFFGDLAVAMDWLTARPAPAAPATDRTAADQAIRLFTGRKLQDVPGWTDEIDQAWQTRADALAAYREQLPPETDAHVVLESLLHLHHNRAIGIDPDSERTCRRLARQAALAWRARQEGDDR